MSPKSKTDDSFIELETQDHGRGGPIQRSNENLDDELLTRTGKKPVLKVDILFHGVRSTKADELKARFWVYDHSGL